MSAARQFQVSVIQAKPSDGDDGVELIHVPLRTARTQAEVDRLLRSGATLCKHIVDVVENLK